MSATRAACNLSTKTYLIRQYKKFPNVYHWSMGGGVVSELWTFYYASSQRFFWILFDNNLSNRKRCTYLKGCFKTSSKSRNIKLVVNWNKLAVLQPLPPFTCKPLENFKILLRLLVRMNFKTSYAQTMEIRKNG